MSRRTRAREIVLKCLYAYETLDKEAKTVFDDTCAKTSQDVRSTEFASNLYFGVIERLEEIDKQIASNAENWNIDRFAVVDKNIMRMAVCELFYFPDIPAKVSINEAIELAKKYSTVDSSSFVNGILDAIYRKNVAELEEKGKVRTE
ncbi:MAG: transcription antitermination factor NusB [candidate division Zixibacteria bacterium]|nr:transcription antitermination factor NusB [candidate division Zixibacteria bacterium]